jgi:hypothetical protein
MPPLPKLLRRALPAAVLLGVTACAAAPELELVCEDVVRSRCERFREQWRNDPALRAEEIERIVVTCVLGECDERSGTVSIHAVLRDRSVHDLGGGGWRE